MWRPTPPHISLTCWYPTFSNTSSKPSHIPCFFGCPSLNQQKSIVYIQCYSKIIHQRYVLFQTLQKKTRRGNSGTPSVGSSNLSPASKVYKTPSHSYKLFLTRCVHKFWTPRFKNLQNQCGAINLLHGSNLCGVGVPIFQTQRSGCPRLFSGPTICDLSEIIPPPGQFQPLPITILHFLCSIFQGSSTRDQSFYDLKWISFFFLLQSRE